MAVSIPTPLKGWRVFIGEVGTILLGVLLALGAQELVQSLHWRGQVRETREALDAELSRDLAAFDYRLSESECITARMAELERWAESFRNGRPLRLKHEVVNTPGFAFRTEVWELVDSDIASRIPLKDRLNYSGLYSGMKSFSTAQDQEGDAWTTIMEYQDAAKLDQADIRKLLLAIKGLAESSAAFPMWNTTMGRQARELGLKPDPMLVKTANPRIAEMRQRACQPYI